MKMRILLSGAVLAAMMMLIDVNAQQVTTTDAITDYSVLHENTAPATYRDSVTVGGAALSDSIEGGGNASNMVMPYFVMPDPFLNGGYDNGDGTFNNGSLNSEWNWSSTGGTVQPANFTAGITANTDTLNQVFIDWGAATGNYTVEVYEETNPTACPGDTSYINVDVIAAPTAVIPTVDELYCESDGTSKVIAVTLTGVPPFNFRLDSIITANNTDGTVANINSGNEIITTGASNGDVTAGVGTLTGAGTAWTFTFDAKTMATDGGRITTREYYVTGVNGRISRKSDRATETGGNNIYYYAQDVVSFTVYPTPNTGNIYNIDN